MQQLKRSCAFSACIENMRSQLRRRTADCANHLFKKKNCRTRHFRFDVKRCGLGTNQRQLIEAIVRRIRSTRAVRLQKTISRPRYFASVADRPATFTLIDDGSTPSDLDRLIWRREPVP
jgi:hypothetical protein